MDDIHWGGVCAVVVMFAAFLVIGWLASRKASEGNATDLILAGRALPLWLAVMTMTATWVDGGYLNGTAEGAYDPSQGVARAARTGICFGISLILGGLLFARTMRRHEFTTLVDPFADRFGPRWAAVLVTPALVGETIWCGALLVALGSTFRVILHIDQRTAFILSAVIVTLYTMKGGMWSVAWTDAFQLLLIPVGLLAALPFVLDKAGGFDAVLTHYETTRPAMSSLLPPMTPNAQWDNVALVGFWEGCIVLILGGIPWNCYFQRVLSCQTPGRAVSHSLLAGVLTTALVFPPLLLGMSAVTIYAGASGAPVPPDILPSLLHNDVPYFIGILGLAAIVGAVTSSYSASILSAGSMLAWNVYRPLVSPAGSLHGLKRVIRLAIVGISVAATALALSVGSVFELWTFTADLVFVLLFPQLLWALFDPKVNRTGSITAFVASLLLRMGGGEPLFGVPAFIDYPRLLPEAMVGNPENWYHSESGAMLFPFRSVAAAVGLILLPVVSRLTGRWDPSRPLRAIPE